MFAHTRNAEVLLDRGRVELDRVCEERTTLCDEIVETLRARRQQCEDAEEPGVPRREELVMPQPGRFEERLQPRGEIFWCETRDVLLVEPVELLRVEHRVAAADPLEREDSHQL